jgi:hypothetical protein
MLRRILVSLLCLLSIAVSATAGALWVRSARLQDYWHLHRDAAPGRHERSVTIELAGGWIAADTWEFIHVDPQLMFLWRRLEPHTRQKSSEVQAQRVNPTTGAHIATFAGFVMETKLTDEYRWRRVVVPLWSVVAVGLILPVILLLRRMRRRRRIAKGRCPACGYDLRASRGRCPECGRTIAEAVGPKRSLNVPSEGK